jgi:RimJ/RimL family protein N-acetyltransferase
VLGPTLQGELISLEAARVEDLETFRHWFEDPEITRYVLMRFVPSSEHEAEWYRTVAGSDQSVHWRVVVEGETIGSTGLHGIDWINRHAESGTMIGVKGQWGKGFGSEIVRLRTRFAFEELGLERLETTTFASNAPMQRCLEKSGYRRIGLRRRYLFRGNTWHDAVVFELLREEWNAR